MPQPVHAAAREPPRHARGDRMQGLMHYDAWRAAASGCRSAMCGWLPKRARCCKWRPYGTLSTSEHLCLAATTGCGALNDSVEHKVGWFFVTTRSNAFRCALMHLVHCGPAMCSFGTLCMCGCQCARAIPILKAGADILTPWRLTHTLTAAFRRHNLTDPPWAGPPTRVRGGNRRPWCTEHGRDVSRVERGHSRVRCSHTS